MIPISRKLTHTDLYIFFLYRIMKAFSGIFNVKRFILRYANHSPWLPNYNKSYPLKYYHRSICEQFKSIYFEYKSSHPKKNYLYLFFSGNPRAEEPRAIRNNSLERHCTNCGPRPSLHQQLHKSSPVRFSEFSLQKGFQEGSLLWPSSTDSWSSTHEDHEVHHKWSMHGRLVSRADDFRLKINSRTRQPPFQTFKFSAKTFHDVCKLNSVRCTFGNFVEHGFRIVLERRFCYETCFQLMFFPYLYRTYVFTLLWTNIALLYRKYIQISDDSIIVNTAKKYFGDWTVSFCIECWSKNIECIQYCIRC